MRRFGISCQQGFSLAELIIVLSVIAILTALVASRISYHRVKSMNSACNGLMSLIKRAADAYYAETGGIVPTVSDLVAEGYLSDVPKDPHDHPNQYIVINWDTEGGETSGKCWIVCPKSPPPPAPQIVFPPGHDL